MTSTTARERMQANSYTSGRLPRWFAPALFGASLVIGMSVIALLAAAEVLPEFPIVLAVLVGVVLYDVLITVIASAAEGRRAATDRLFTSLVITAFVIALLPLISLLYTVVVNGAARFDLTFFTNSMRSVIGEGGGALHAIVGTLQITALATIISVPVGLFAAIYLVEYGRGPLKRAITFFVDVMTGIPSIVAGLFAYALFALFFGEGVRMGFAGSVALAVLMIPVVVRSSEEMLKLVPDELREASYALGVPKWRTVAKVVLPTAGAGIVTGITLAIARVIGETAPLLIVAGFTSSMNYNPFSERMQSLPVFVYTQYANPGSQVEFYLERAWAGALSLILIVMALNLIARLITRYFTPRTRR